MFLTQKLTRRCWLQVGSAGLLGLSLPALLQAEAGQPQRRRRARNAILFWLNGGPSHYETFDPKPDAAVGIRGALRPRATRIPGVTFSELLPLLAGTAQRLTILRGVHHHLPEHNPGSMYLLGSGNPPSAALTYPSFSAVAQKEFAATPGLPTTVGIPNEPPEGPGPGYLGPAYQTFAAMGDPNARDFDVRSLTLPPGVDAARLERRRRLRDAGDRFFDDLDQPPPLLAGLNRFYQDAHTIINSPATRRAFAIQDEPAALRERYGRNSVGQRLLLARRLVEAGVRFVSVTSSIGWDMHKSIFEAMGAALPLFDRALHALIEDLSVRGLLDETLVMVLGEFGRTPRINHEGGRDHWPQAMSIVLAGGGVPAGLVHGATDRDGAHVVDGSHSPADFACTVYTLLGIDPHQHYQAPNGQPVPIVRGGAPIAAVVGS